MKTKRGKIEEIENMRENVYEINEKNRNKKNKAPRTEKVDKRTKRRQLFRLVENFIVQHCNENNGHAPYKEIVTTCQYEFGLAKKEAEGIINALVELGILIRPNKLKPRMQQPPTAKKTVQIEEALPLADD